MTMGIDDRWGRLMAALGFGPNLGTLVHLLEAYAEPHRYYHNWSHIESCLEHLDAVSHLAERPAEIEIALWFHDAVYKPLSRVNEERCATMAGVWLASNNAPQDVRLRVESMITRTRHDSAPATTDEALMLDIDLAILGSDAADYDAYSAAVRSEYRLLPERYYNKQRAQVLSRFVNRPLIYWTPRFQESRETRARENLAREISELNSSAGPAADPH